MVADFYPRSGNGPTTAGGAVSCCDVMCESVCVYIYNSEMLK